MQVLARSRCSIRKFRHHTSVLIQHHKVLREVLFRRLLRVPLRRNFLSGSILTSVPDSLTRRGCYDSVGVQPIDRDPHGMLGPITHEL